MRAGHLAISTLNAIMKIVLSVDDEAEGFLGTEEHLSSALHVHGLIRWPEPRPYISKAVLRGLLWRKLFDRMGRSEVVTPRSIGGVSAYVAKYVTKGLTDYVVW